MRTFDELGNIGDEIHESSVDSVSPNIENKTTINIPITRDALNIITYPEQSSVEIALNQDRIPNLLGMSNNSSNVETNVSNITPKHSKDASCTDITENVNTDVPTTPSSQKQSSHGELSVNKLNENKLLQSEEKKLSDYTTKQILHEPELELLPCIDDSIAVDPLEFSGEFDYSDEFANTTNLPDNTDFLKSLAANSSNISFSKDDTVTSENKTEDSDVEILENTKSAKIAEKMDTNDANQSVNPASSKQKTEKEEQLTACDTEDKHTSEETTASSVNITATPDEPLTLEDIKHTGYSGLELYKCGYEECSFAALNSSLLRVHMKECTCSANNTDLHCVHCKKRFIKIGFLLEHLKAHGLKRFGCSLCKMRYAVAYQATGHMKAKHKHVITKLIPADPTNPSADGLFIVQAQVCL